MRNKLLCSVASAAIIAICAQGALGMIVPVAEVDGKIIDTDGARLLYQASANPRSASLLTLQTGSMATVQTAGVPNVGFVTRTGAIFNAPDSRGTQYPYETYWYNGSTWNDLGGLSSEMKLVGDYAQMGTSALNTATGQWVVLPHVPQIAPGTQSFWEAYAVRDTGSWLAWSYTSMVHVYTSYYYDQQSGLVDLGKSKTWNVWSALTDGSMTVVSGAQVLDGTSRFMLVLYDDKYLTHGVSILSPTSPNPREWGTARLMGTDYQIANGWILFRDFAGNLIERSPSGARTSFGPSDSILELADDGEFAFYRGGTLYLHTFADGDMPLPVGITGAVKSGSQWYLYGGGQLFTLGTQAVTVPIDEQFISFSTKYIALGSTRLQAAGNLSTSRGIILNDAITVDTQSFTLGLSGVLEGPGSLVKAGSGNLILTANETYTGGTTILSGSLQLGDGGSIRGDVVDQGLLVFNRSDIFTFDGTISGTGGVQLTGPGTIIFTGINDYTGGTTISAGALEVEGGFLPGDVVNNGTIKFASDLTVFSGIISGTGALVQSSGTTVFTGANTYTGGTTIEPGGTLQLGAGGSSGSITGDVVLGGTLVFARSDTFTFNGRITDYSATQEEVLYPGIVQQNGDGTTVLTGTNTYTGGTTISAGTLQVGAGGTTGSIIGDVVDDGTLVFNRSDTLTFAGAISGTGTVTQTGKGILVLNGANTVTGATTVSAGTLMVGDAAHPDAWLSGNVAVAQGATLSGHGAIGGSVNNGGTVAPGGSIGVFSVQSYTQASTGTLAVEISPSAASRLLVAGAAALNGNLLLSFDAGSYGANNYRLLDANVITGGFATISTANAPAGLMYGLQHTSSATGGVAGSGLNLVIQPSSDAQLYGDFTRSSYAMAETLNDMALAHFDDRGGSDVGRESVGIWLQPFAGLSANDDNAGFNTHWHGVVGGIDSRIEPGYAINIAAAYVASQLAVTGRADRISIDTFYTSLTGRIPLFDGSVDVNGHYLQNNGHAARAIASGAMIATAAPKNELFGGAMQVSYPLWIDNLTASARLTYVSADPTTYQESGAEPYDLMLDAKRSSDLYGDLRLRYRHDVHICCAQFVADVSAGLRAIFGSTSHKIEASLVDTVGSSVAGWDTSIDRWAFVAGLGLKSQGSGECSLFIRSDGRISKHEREGVIMLGAVLEL